MSDLMLRCMAFGLAQQRTSARETARQRRCGIVDAELLAILLRNRHARPIRSRCRARRAREFSFIAQVDCGRPAAILRRARPWARAVRGVQAAVEIARRQLSETLRAGPSLASPRATRDFLSSQLRDLEHEVFAASTSISVTA